MAFTTQSYAVQTNFSAFNVNALRFVMCDQSKSCWRLQRVHCTAIDLIRFIWSKKKILFLEKKMNDSAFSVWFQNIWFDFRMFFDKKKCACGFVSISMYRTVHTENMHREWWVNFHTKPQWNHSDHRHYKETNVFCTSYRHLYRCDYRDSQNKASPMHWHCDWGIVHRIHKHTIYLI